MKTHTVELRVRYADTDKMGVVYYANYFQYFEVGRTEYLRGIGHSYRGLEDEEVFFAVTETSCRYLAPARYDDELRITTWVDRLRPSRIDFRHIVENTRDGVEVATGRVVLACVTREGRPRAIPAAVSEGIEVTEARES